MRRFVFTIGILAILSYSVLWYAFPKHSFSSELTVALLDIGQGDAMYVRAPDGSDMLIDGGPRGALLKPLREILPFDDTNIDVLVITNPDADHYAGFLDILDSYTVGAIVEAGTHSNTKTYQEFETRIQEKHIPRIVARKGMRIILDRERAVEYDVLFPDRDVSNWKTNDGSVVGKITYGVRSFLCTGDAPIYTESLMLSSIREQLASDVLKVGHHGSRTSTSDAFIKAVHPTYAIISAGKANRYGHPHQETLNRLKKYHIPTLGTYDSGTIICSTNGQKLSCG